MIVIGLTGGIGSGKTTAADFLREKGIPVIDADLIAREIVQPGTPAHKEIEETFGNEVFLYNRELDRKKLGSLVFNDQKKLSILNDITHKEIVRTIKERLQMMEERGEALVFIDAALLYETGLDHLTQWVWVVDAPDDVRVKRLVERDGLSEEEIMKRICSQMPRQERNRRGHLVLDNSKGERDLRELLLQSLKQYGE